MEKQLRVILKVLFKRGKSPSPVTVIAVIAISVVLLGEIFAYGTNIHGFDSNADMSSPGTLNYSVSSKGSDTYSVALMDRKNVKPVEKLYIYIDENYEKYYNDARNTCPVEFVHQKDHAKQMQKLLDIRGFKNVTIVDSEKLRDVLHNDIKNSNCLGCGLLVTSFSLPSNVYSGNDDDLLFKWINNGGYLYWSSSEIGGFYYKDGKINRVENYQTLFFNSKCVNVSNTEHAIFTIDNKIREALTLKNTGLKFALNVNKIPNSLGIGSEENGYSPIAFVKHNNGMICVIGAMSEHISMFEDTAQIISAGITYDTEIVSMYKGNVTRNTVSNTIYYPKSINDVGVYIYIGGTYTVYGRCFR